MISTHVLDTSTGHPAVGMAVVLEIHRGSEWVRLSSGLTDDHGRFVALPEMVEAGPGVYRFSFDTGDYHRVQGLKPFFPEVQVVFAAREPGARLHVPLLISPFGYSCYRGT